MPELAYIINHAITAAWLCLAGIYVYYAVLANVVAVFRGRERKEDPTRPIT